MDRQDWRERRSYHKVSDRRPLPKPARRRITFFILPLIIVMFYLNSQAFIDRHKSTSDPPQASASRREPTEVVIEATPDQVGAVIDSFTSGNWGQETLDRAELLSNSLEQQVDQPYAASTAIYLWLLATHAPLDQANDMLLAQVARYMGKLTGDEATEAVLEQYRTALRNVQLPE